MESNHNDISDDDDLDWDEALKAEDSVRVSFLLENNGELLDRGWKELEALAAEDSVRVENLLQKFEGLLHKESKDHVEASLKTKRQGVWKGRTALHVAARRGDAKLVQQIRDILHPEDGKCSTRCHLLEVINSDYELDALAMAFVNGEQRIITLLKQASSDCRWNPYHVSHNNAEIGSVSGEEGANTSGLSEEKVKQLENITEKVLPKNSPEYSLVRAIYDKDCDFNFLGFDLYLFHFTFSTWVTESKVNHEIGLVRRAIFSNAEKDSELLGCLLQLWDGQGRTPLHVAVESNKVQDFLDLRPTEGKAGDLDEKFLNAKDNAGRTPLYRAAAQNKIAAVMDLLNDKRVSLNVTMKCAAHQWGLDVDKLSWKNNFKSDCVYILDENLRRKAFNNKRDSQGVSGPNIKPLEEISSTALHVAMINKHFKVVKCIVDEFLRRNKDGGTSLNTICQRRFTWPVSAAWMEDIYSTPDTRYVSTMKLAVLVGSIPILQHLLKAEERIPGIFSSADDEKYLPSFHLAAAKGDPKIIQAFINSERGEFDPRKKDVYNNTALHHALKGKHVKFHPHLVDFVGCSHVLSWRWEKDDFRSDWLANPYERKHQRSRLEISDNLKLSDRYASQRLGSINLLGEAGVDIWAENDYQRTANPESDASEEFVKWWYEKVAQQKRQDQEKLNAAANAISVTAALVATASYVGPLQPPLGYGDDSLRVNILAVRIFVVCDGLSFSLALAAIILALIPSIPVPQESMSRELVGTKFIVAVALSFLFPSIVFVLGAFAAGYIAVIPDHGRAHGLIVATLIVGGLLCLLVMIAFWTRLLKVYRALPYIGRRELGRFFRVSRL